MISGGRHWVIEIFTLQKQQTLLLFLLFFIQTCTYIQQMEHGDITLWNMMNCEARCRHGRFEKQ